MWVVISTTFPLVLLMGILGSFEINHDKAGFADFFEQVEHYKLQSNGKVSVAMEGYNGHARPLDKMIRKRITSHAIA